MLPAYKSDHSPIELTFRKPAQPRGKGTWKLNDSILTNTDFIDLIRKSINQAKSTYALPVYLEDLVHSDVGESLQLTISDTLCLETSLSIKRGGGLLRFQNIVQDLRGSW